MKRTFLLLIILLTITYGQETGARYLIITHDDYYNALAPIAEWKTRKGYKTMTVPLSETGSSPLQIRNYVINAYNTWDIQPEFLLLVGNSDQIPMPPIISEWQGQSLQVATDNYYTDVAGDFHNEIIPGRFWVSDTVQAKTVVAKVLGYDRNPYLDDSLWFRKGVTIVNEYEEGQPSSESLYWADAHYAIDLMTNAGFVHIDSFAYSLGNSSADVINAMNSGRSYFLYRGIGYFSWAYPFQDIYSELMANGYKLPIVISATCATLQGIGQSWLAVGTPEQPAGVVGFLSTTTALYEAAELRSVLARGTYESIFCDSFTTLGKATEAGRIMFYDTFDITLEYLNWTCLGDPEMSLWTGTPKLLSVIHNSSLQTRVCTVSVNVQYHSVPMESALVCLSTKRDSTVYQYGRTNSLGNIQFIDEFHIPADSAFVTVTGRNLKPYCGAIRVSYPSGAYVLLKSFSVVDTAGGNGNLIPNPGEDLEIPVVIFNWGDSTAYDVSAVLRKIDMDPYFTLIDTVKVFGDIAPLDSAFTTDAYNIQLTPDCPDTHTISLQLITKDINDSTWISNFSFKSHGPNIAIQDYYFPGLLQYSPAGDTSDLFMTLENFGSYQADNVTAEIFSNDTFLILIDATASFGTILPDSVKTSQFTIASQSGTPPGHAVNISVVVNSGVYIDTLDLVIYIGQKDYLIWDSDLNHSSGPVIKSKLDLLDFNGDYATALPYGMLSIYKAIFVCCGVNPNTYIIYDTSQAGSEIETYLTAQDGKAYMEGGDVWYTDPYFFHGYNFCSLFDIDAISSTIGSFPRVKGMDNTFTEEMYFRYQGDALLLDAIDTTNGSIEIFEKNMNPYQNCGVAANNKTIGLSFEFGGLVDSLPPGTKTILMDSIMKYFGILPTGLAENTTAQNTLMPIFTIFPNPCRGAAIIKYQIPNTSTGVASSEEKVASIKIYDVSGRTVKSFSLSTAYSLLPATLSWTGIDDLGRKVNQGIYFVRLEAPELNNTIKVIYLK